jgi:histidine triad (HIT) family protein
MAERDWYCEDVLSGKKQVKVIWQDEFVLAILHPFPDLKAAQHAVVIPKKHVSSAMSPEATDGMLLGSMMKAIQKVATELGIDKTGKGFYVTFNAESPDVTPHMHWHIKAPIPES